MCKQLEVLEKIHKEGKMNGFAVELADATAQDYIKINKKICNIEKDMGFMKKDMRTLLENQARQGGQIDLIVKRMNSPIEEERQDGIFWRQLKSIAKTPTGKIIILLMLGCIALAGDKILQLVGLIK